MRVSQVIKDIHISIRDILNALANRLHAEDNFAPDGISGQVLTSNGPDIAPSWQDVPVSEAEDDDDDAGGDGSGIVPNHQLGFNDDWDEEPVLPAVPVAETLWGTFKRPWYDAHAYTHARIVCDVVDINGYPYSEFKLLFSTTPSDSTSWQSAGLVDDVILIAGSADSLRGPWFAMKEECRGDVAWKVVTQNGDGATDLEIGYLGVEFSRQLSQAAPALVPWYLRNLSSSADLDAMPVSPLTTGTLTWLNPLGENPRRAFNAGNLLLEVSGGSSGAHDFDTEFQLSRTKKPVGSTGARLILSPPDVNFNYSRGMGRFPTPGLIAQVGPQHTARVHLAMGRYGGITGYAFAQVWLKHWRPAVGLVAEYSASASQVTGTQMHGIDPFYATLDIKVPKLTIQENDRLVLELHGISNEDTIARATDYDFDGRNEGPLLASPERDFAARVDMFNYATIPGTE